MLIFPTVMLILNASSGAVLRFGGHRIAGGRWKWGWKRAHSGPWNHEELLAADGAYARLYSAQFSGSEAAMEEIAAGVG